MAAVSCFLSVVVVVHPHRSTPSTPSTISNAVDLPLTLPRHASCSNLSWNTTDDTLRQASFSHSLTQSTLALTSIFSFFQAFSDFGEVIDVSFPLVLDTPPIYSYADSI
jgi:hypothetical protein